MSDTISEVAEQYNKWVYPLPIHDLPAAARRLTDKTDPSKFWPLIWPRKRDADNIDILVAGCGTNQAALIAYNNPKCRITGIDISNNSINHQLTLKSKYDLNNLELMKMDLLHVGLLDKKFDYIICGGVIHHLREPAAGLNALRSVLATDGVISLGVYRKASRAAVYLLQDAFRTMGLEQSQNDVDLIKSTLASLPKNHVIHQYLSADDAKYDAGIVDSFLHPQDTAYTVRELYELLRESGLSFHTWFDRRGYNISSAFPPGHPIIDRVNRLSIMDHAHVTDMFLQSSGLHILFAAEPEFIRKNQISFDNDGWRTFRLRPNPDLKVIDLGSFEEARPAVMERAGHRFVVPPNIFKVLQISLNGDNIGRILEDVDSFGLEKIRFAESVKQAIYSLWQSNHFYVLL